MYELVKQKNTGFRIILGIIVFAFISLLLKLAFNQKSTSLKDDLISAANQINSHAPIIIDSTLRFDRVDALHDNIFQYNYTLTSVDASQIDTSQLKSNSRQLLIENAKKDPKSSLFRENGVVIQARYFDKNGKYITEISVSPTEY